jgi:inosine/xanthosine triphosphatase
VTAGPAKQVDSRLWSARTPLSSIDCVRVGTLNGPKLEAVRAAVAAYAPRVRVEGVAVASGVPEQPVGYDEIVAGARNRARRAHATGACDLAVGIEDGLVELHLADLPVEVLNVGCAFVTDGRRDSVGLSSAFAYPPACAEPAVRDRTPIGGSFDRLFATCAAAAPSPAVVEQVPSGLTIGNIGKLTLGILPRSDYARHAVLCALVRFLHPELYDPETRG